MENFEAPESPPVTYPMDAATPGDNWNETRFSLGEDNEVYVPVPGDEGHVDGDFTICREPKIPRHVQTIQDCNNEFRFWDYSRPTDVLSV